MARLLRLSGCQGHLASAQHGRINSSLLSGGAGSIVSESMLARAIASLRHIEGEVDRVDTLKRLAPLLPKSLLPQALDIMWTFANEFHRSEALNALIPYLSEPLLRKAWTVLAAMRNESCRISALGKLVPKLATITKPEIYILWRDSLHFYSHCHRSELLAAIETMAPVISVLGGEQAIQKTVLAIKETRSWWS